MQFKLLGTVAVCLLLAACSDPKDYKLSRTGDWKQDPQLQRNIQQLTDPDRKLIGEYLLRAEEIRATGGAVPESISIGQAIENQAQWNSVQEEQQAAAALKAKVDADMQQKADAVNAKVLEEMQTALSPAVESFEYVEEKKQGHFNIGMTFANNSKTKIVGITGDILIRDQAGTDLKHAFVSTDSAVPPGEVLNQVWRLDYNAQVEGDKVLKDADASKLVFGWQPRTYRFADGREVTLGE
ncbi:MULTISPECIES: hypothetical protein [unclassified Pseudomonas]|uniref:hypothetical protein n=1 Tax=unclassified Pseudomonas TaxID=196821 RepID=UPI001032F227|nr:MULTISPECIES: hypothetical protein [unclassified Pseudomonas]